MIRRDEFNRSTLASRIRLLNAIAASRNRYKYEICRRMMNEKRAACWHQVLTRSNNSFNWIFFKVAILTFFAFTVFRFRQTAWTERIVATVAATDPRSPLFLSQFSGYNSIPDHLLQQKSAEVVIIFSFVVPSIELYRIRPCAQYLYTKFY